MKIKQPDSDNALVSLCTHIDEAQFTLRNCVAQSHEVVSVAYISSLLIMPNVAFRGIKLIDRIISLANLTPDCVCLIRTTTPEYFRGRMKALQKAALNSLRSKCYVVVFSPYGEFLNHAKFLVHYNVCLSEQVVHYGNFFGSTNFTGVGLGAPNMHGNFEEFAENGGVKHAYNMTTLDRKYLKEVLYLMNYKAWLYTDSKYLVDHVSGHIRAVEELIDQRKQESKYSKLDTYRKYLLSMTFYNQTLALLDDIPGKKLTSKMVEELVSSYPPENPFEIEAMSGNQNYEDSIRDLGFDEKSLREVVETSNDALRRALNMIRERYEPTIERIREYFDEREEKFFMDLEKHHVARVLKISIPSSNRRNMADDGKGHPK